MTGTERKVFQKYYPPDFDPSKLPKAKGGRNRQFVQRVMAPFNMQCNTCRAYIYKGKKFNMRRETVEGESYLNLKLFRFYFRCPNCLAEISFKTDLENCDYQQEHGATRLFDAFKHYQEQARKEEAEEEAEKADAMKMLEKRTKMSKQEMKAMGDLEEIQELNRRNERIDARDYVLTDRQKALILAEKQRQEAEEDAEVVKQLFFKQRQDGLIIRRIDDDDDELSQEGSLGLRLRDKAADEKKLLNTLLNNQVSIGRKPDVTSKDYWKNKIVVKKRKADAEPSDEPGPSTSRADPGPSTVNTDPGPSTSSFFDSPGPSGPSLPIASSTGTSKPSTGLPLPAAGPSQPKKSLMALADYGSDSE